VQLYGALLAPGQSVTHAIPSDRHAYLHVATGSVSFGEHTLREGDAACISDEAELSVTGLGDGTTDAELLLFDLA
jgi:redox-sensitive bicupin YhaK (pirin superfamily)